MQLDEILGEGVAHAREHAGDRREEDVDVRVGEHELEHRAVLGPRGDHAAGVEWVVAAQEPRHVLAEGVDGGLREPRHEHTVCATQVGDVRRGSTRHRVHTHATGPVDEVGMTEHARHLDHLVEVVDPDHAELVEHRLMHRVGTGEVAGVRLRHRAAFLGATDLDRDDGHAALRGFVGGKHEGTPVAETLHVRRDGADVVDVDVVPDEVGPLEIGFVADRRPRLDADAEHLALRDRPPLVSGLRDDHELLAREALRPGLEDVEVGVRADDPHRAARELGESRLGRSSLVGAHFPEAGREHDGERDALRQALLDGRDRVAHEHDGNVDVTRNVADRAVGASAEDVGLRRVHGHDVGARARRVDRASG